MAQYLPNNKDIGGYAEGFPIIAATAVAEAEPAYIIPTGSYQGARTYCAYSGTVSACTLRLWFYVGGTWYRGATTDDGNALTGANEARDWVVEPDTHVGFTVDSISGGGTVTVRVEGVNDGAA